MPEYPAAERERYKDFRIQELWIFVMLDPDGEESIMMVPRLDIDGDKIGVPLIAADPVRLEQVRAEAIQAGRKFRVRVRMLHFGHITHAEEVYAPGAGA